MEGQNESIYASPPFKFIIDGNPLYIHADLVSLHSKPLDRLMNGHMAEAQKGFAILEDVDEGTFVRFIQWAYNGYYSPPTYDILDDVLVNEGSKEAEGATANSTADLMADLPAHFTDEDGPVPEPFPEADEPYNDGLSFGGYGGRKASKKAKKKAFWNVEPTPEFIEVIESSSKAALRESFRKHKTTVHQNSIAYHRLAEIRTHVKTTLTSSYLMRGYMSSPINMTSNH